MEGRVLPLEPLPVEQLVAGSEVGATGRRDELLVRVPLDLLFGIHQSDFSYYLFNF
jgi:hypothetical protein